MVKSDDPFRAAVEALAAADIPAELERSPSGQLQLTIRGEAVDAWTDDDGPWVIVAVQESGGAEPSEK